MITIFQEPKYMISFLTGIAAVLLGGIPILNSLGLLKWKLPFALGATILLWAVAAFGAYLLIDSFVSEDDMMMWISVIIALVILAVSVIEILYSFKVIKLHLPFLNLLWLQILFTIEGIGLLIAAFGSK